MVNIFVKVIEGACTKPHILTEHIAHPSKIYQSVNLSTWKLTSRKHGCHLVGQASLPTLEAFSILSYLSLWPLGFGFPTWLFMDLDWTGIVLLHLSKVFGILSTKSRFLAWFASPPDAPAIGTSIDLVWKHFIHPRISPNNTILGMVLGHGWHFALSRFLWFSFNRKSGSLNLLWFYFFTFPQIKSRARFRPLQNAAFLVALRFAIASFFGPFATRSRLLLTALLQILLPRSSQWRLHLRGHFRRTYLREKTWTGITGYTLKWCNVPFETALQYPLNIILDWTGGPMATIPTIIPTFSGVSSKEGRSTGLGVTWSMGWVSTCAKCQSCKEKSIEDRRAIRQTYMSFNI